MPVPLSATSVPFRAITCSVTPIYAIMDGQYHDYLKKMPSISKDYENDYFFKARPGRSRHDYKMRSILALALYYIHHPQIPAEVIDQLLSNFGFGHRFIKNVKAFIDQGGFDHES